VLFRSGYEELIKKNDGNLKGSRTGLGLVALKAAEEGADIAGSADGRYVFPSFLPAPDCFMTIARALELFSEEPLSGVHALFGDSFGDVRYRRLECPWTAKGRVMRGLAEKFGGDADTILTDGVKLNLDEDSWVLMLPDPDNPLFYVYAEANGSKSDSKDRSEGIVLEYTKLVENLIKSE
jgi:mannose-1-phosphate guanylyltransferase/phosphomannomutase